MTSRYDLAALLYHASFDVHPPLYYLLLHGWMVLFGDSILAMAFEHYNEWHPHSTLGYRSPREITERWLTKYNSERPHESLNNLTPEEYRLMAEKPKLSKSVWN
ncbi:insertion element IS2 transposase InsD [Serratia entomophila]|nr:insertion element IS2 transposase InsD [Serratia entomophila]CAI1060354.1 insertion element IS2 transposase InsD [Serratia entomophila]CAI1731433.1 insertion element IS2 transposase InsD [Serratia entomophila]CAI1788231.1 insertion element IS2 transposase InsD [Serratia entomophila]